MKRPEIDGGKRITVRLSEAELAALPDGEPLSKTVRRALERQREDARHTGWRDDIAARLDAIDRALATPATRNDDVLSTLSALETGPRVVRIETFLVLIAEALARFMEHYGALHATVERIDGALLSARDRSADDDAATRWTAARDRVLEQIFDPFDLQIQAMTTAIATPGAATESCGGGPRHAAETPPESLPEAAE